jgi:hypothetical protein
MSKETVVVQFASEHTLSLWTSFVIGAIIVGSARQHANAIGTNHSSGTSLGWQTSVGHTNAFNFSISGEAFGTNALFDVIGDGALAINATRRGVVTWVDTITTDADFGRSTLTIHGTFGSSRNPASEVHAYIIPRTIGVSSTQLLLTTRLIILGITKEAIRTSANGPVITGLADSITSAHDGSLTDIFALPLT